MGGMEARSMVYGVVRTSNGEREFFLDEDEARRTAQVCALHGGSILMAYYVTGDPALIVAALNDLGWFDSAQVIEAYTEAPRADGSVKVQRLSLVRDEEDDDQ